MRRWLSLGLLVSVCGMLLGCDLGTYQQRVSEPMDFKMESRSGTNNDADNGA